MGSLQFQSRYVLLIIANAFSHVNLALVLVLVLPNGYCRMELSATVHQTALFNCPTYDLTSWHPGLPHKNHFPQHLLHKQADDPYITSTRKEQLVGWRLGWNKAPRCTLSRASSPLKGATWRRMVECKCRGRCPEHPFIPLKGI